MKNIQESKLSQWNNSWCWRGRTTAAVRGSWSNLHMLLYHRSEGSWMWDQIQSLCSCSRCLTESFLPECLEVWWKSNWKKRLYILSVTERCIYTAKLQKHCKSLVQTSSRETTAAEYVNEYYIYSLQHQKIIKWLCRSSGASFSLLERRVISSVLCDNISV